MTTFGSLFSGIGGFDLGLELAGLQCKWQCELNDFAIKILERHWPNVKRFKDVRDVNGRNAATVDVIVGGFPCQDLSIAGRRKGLAGEQSGLWFEFYRILKDMQPKLVVIENVPGLLSSNDGRDFAIILRGLVGIGYGVSWRIFDSQYFGVAQQRRRLFIVGSFGNGRSAQILFEPQKSTVLPIKVAQVSSTILTKYGQRWDDSETLIDEGGTRIRKLTPTEVEKLQGFPIGWTSGQSDSRRYHQLGNAVTVPVIKWIGERIEKTKDN